MPSYTYNGLEESITLRGVTFLKGEPVEVDADFESKLDSLPYFTSDKPKPKATNITALRDQEIDGYKRQIAGLEAENAGLRKRLNEASQPALEPTPVKVTPEEEVISEYTPGQPDPDLEIPHPGAPKLEEIPADWRDMHWKRQLVLAKKFTDMEINNGSDAVTAIEMELERRGD